MLEDFMTGGMISVSHMQPDATNISMLKAAGCNKGILHIRDPRPAAFSLVKFLQGRHFPFAGLLLETDDGADYHALSETAQIDYVIRNAFSKLVKWISDWCDLLDRDSYFNYLVLAHEQLVADEDAYFERIFEFYGMRASLVTVEKTAETHFRCGDNNNWRDAFTTDQIGRVNDLMPARLCNRFGWSL
jgi:hypothetical protein